MNDGRLEFWLAIFLVIYLLAFGVGAALGVIGIFPTSTGSQLQFPVPLDPEQGLLSLAFLAGVAGSFLHAAQSLSSYIGNKTFKASWAVWYFLRPWVGGVLGLTIYFVLRAGLVGGAGAINPYGVVAVGVLGGWFSKVTTDKLKEVFEALFKTDEDGKRRDKLLPQPVVEGVEPAQPIPPGTATIQLLGREFMEGAQVTVNGAAAAARFVSPTQLDVELGNLAPPVHATVFVVVKNPDGAESNRFPLRFE